MKARKGEKIICEKGHEAGHFRQNVEDREPIQTGAIAVGDGRAHDDSSQYRCTVCHAPVARPINGNWEVRTDAGWIR
jgi:hypothetical protein